MRQSFVERVGVAQRNRPQVRQRVAEGKVVTERANLGQNAVEQFERQGVESRRRRRRGGGGVVITGKTGAAVAALAETKLLDAVRERQLLLVGRHHLCWRGCRQWSSRSPLHLGRHQKELHQRGSVDEREVGQLRIIELFF